MLHRRPRCRSCEDESAVPVQPSLGIVNRAHGRSYQSDLISPDRPVKARWNPGELSNGVQPRKLAGCEVINPSDEHHLRAMSTHTGQKSIWPAPKKTGLVDRNNDRTVIACSWHVPKPARLKIARETSLH